MTIRLLHQAKHAEIQDIFFNELKGSFTDNPSFWSGTAEGRSVNFIEMIKAVGQVLNYGGDEAMKESVVYHFIAVYQKGLSGNQYGKLCEIGEVFFRGFQKSPMPDEHKVVEKRPGGYPTSKRIIDALAGLATDENANLEARIAAYHLVKAVQRPELKAYCETVQLPADFNQTNDPVELFPEGYFLPPEPPKRKVKGLTPPELAVAEQNYHIVKNDLCHIDYGDKKVTIAFDKVDNWFTPMYIYGTVDGKWQALPTKGILSIDITAGK